VKQFNHDSSELRAIANLLDAMNEFDAQMEAIGASVQVGPKVWWCGQLMGHIVRANEEDNEGPWVYRPDAYGDEPMVRLTAEQLAIKPNE
jgi:hypothetical protein